ncbi:hypothetical protein SeMB42_g06409 [Synchytrium endobioticum]|uniref:Uncharacterized protein n=1 Tax=Synchytrium endobioticum TaxID=286115 RepID=A0A507CCG1_9FUNG|nr:hypothetical protein SeMB42_g06409 [Synchytrium endobioticum]
MYADRRLAATLACGLMGRGSRGRYAFREGDEHVPYNVHHLPSPATHHEGTSCGALFRKTQSPNTRHPRTKDY